MDLGQLLQRHAGRWHRATQHPLLSATRDGDLAIEAFDAWLMQDYLFVEALLRFQARLLSRAPRHAQAVLAGGLVALVDELSWFERLAEERNTSLTVAPRPATVAYGRLLDELESADVAVALTMLWAIERAYLDAWSFAAPGAAPYREIVAHWTTPPFAAYVEALAQAVEAANPDEASVEEYFPRVVDAEIAFWDMAWDSQ